MSERFHVLHVCTGNIGRSPMAEQIMRARLVQRLGEEEASARFLVDSAGTWGHTGSAMEQHAAAALMSLGIDPGDFRARELTEDHIRSADLVLTATAEHRTTVVGLVPAALHRTFTLREFARLVPDVERELPHGSPPAERLRLAVSGAVVARGRQSRPADASLDDVADPIGAPLLYYWARAEEIDAACVRAVDLLTGVRR